METGGKTMGDYVSCRGCRYCNPNETNGYKCYCEWYRTYEDPDKIHSCNHYSSK